MSYRDIFAVGYQRWRTGERVKSLVAALKAANVDTLVDIRHSPAASNPNPGTMYSPTEINLQSGGMGIAQHLEASGIAYLWLLELGNLQKKDPAMAILRDHIRERDKPWPVQRGLALLQDLVVSGRRTALLCACKDYRKCHRALIAEALKERIPELVIRDLSDG